MTSVREVPLLTQSRRPAGQLFGSVTAAIRFRCDQAPDSARTPQLPSQYFDLRGKAVVKEIARRPTRVEGVRELCASPAPRRSDAGDIRLTGRDVAGLLLCGEMYGAPYDLLAAALAVREVRLRGIVARWRHAGLAATGRLGPGPAWCWLTRAGLTATGLRYAPARPALARLAHIRAVLAVRLAMQDGDAYQDSGAW
jgi:hypothetical protein